MFKINKENTMEVAKMNSSKKEIKAPEKVSKIKQEVKSPIVWIVTSIILLVVLLGGVAFDQLYKRVILTISGDKYNMDDLSYYFYEIESQYDYLDQLFYGGTYWDQTNQTTGQSNREAAKLGAISEAIYNEVLYKEAVANGYTLTEDEKKAADTKADAFLTNDTNKAVIKKNHFTKKYLSDIMGKMAWLRDTVRISSLNWVSMKLPLKPPLIMRITGVMISNICIFLQRKRMRTVSRLT
jgi:foldase protein PrsA